MNSVPVTCNSNFRFILYFSKQIPPATFATSAKRRKLPDDECSTIQPFPIKKGLAQWIENFSQWDFAVVTHCPSLNNSNQIGCDDMPMEHQHIMVHTTSQPKLMEKILKAYIRHEAKTLHEVRARMFLPSNSHNCFQKQFMRFQAEDVQLRGSIFEEYRNFVDPIAVEGKSPKKIDFMENVWEIEKVCPIRRPEITQLNEKQRRILAKVESLEKSESPFKDTIEDFIDILATGWGSIYRVHHSACLEMHCGLTNAQCSCWECRDDDSCEDDDYDESSYPPPLSQSDAN